MAHDVVHFAAVGDGEVAEAARPHAGASRPLRPVENERQLAQGLVRDGVGSLFGRPDVVRLEVLRHSPLARHLKRILNMLKPISHKANTFLCLKF